MPQYHTDIATQQLLHRRRGSQTRLAAWKVDSAQSCITVLGVPGSGLQLAPGGQNQLQPENQQPITNPTQTRSKQPLQCVQFNDKAATAAQ